MNLRAQVVTTLLLTLVLTTQCGHGLNAHTRHRRDAATVQKPQTVMTTPPKVLDGMSKRGTVAFQKLYQEVWNEVKLAKEEYESEVESCKSRIQEAEDEIAARNAKARDTECLPCVQGYCTERILECDIGRLPEEEPQCPEVVRVLEMSNSEDKKRVISRMCSYYQRECSESMDTEDCMRFVRTICVDRFEECAIRNTPSSPPTCDDLVSAPDHHAIKRMCSYYRRECAQNYTSNVCRDAIMEMCMDKIKTCDPCGERFVDTILCEIYHVGSDIRDFFNDDVAIFFKDDVPDFFTSAYSGASTFFEDDFTSFFTEDVKDFFSKDVKDFFAEDVKDFFVNDVSESLVEVWDNAKEFFGEDTPEFFSVGMDTMSDMFDEATGEAGEFFEDVWEDVEEFGSEAVDKVSEFGSDAIDTVSEFGSDAIDEVSEFGAEAFDRVSEFGSDAVDKVSEFGSDAVDKVSEFGSDAVDKVSEFGSDAVDKVSDFGSDVGDFFEDASDSIGDSVEDVFDTVGDEVSDAFDTVSDWFSGLLRRRRRRRDVDEAGDVAGEVGELEPPSCEDLRNSSARATLCLVYSDLCPCEYERPNPLHLDDFCPQMTIANQTFRALRDDYSWLLKIPRNEVTMKFNSFVIDKRNKDPFGLYAARAVATIGGKRVEFGTRIGLSREKFQKHLPEVFEHGFIALEEAFEMDNEPTTQQAPVAEEQTAKRHLF